MTKRAKDRQAFIKFDVTEEAWELFKDASEYWHWSRTSLLRDFVDKWNAYYLEAAGLSEPKEGSDLDTPKAELPEGA